MRGRVMKLLKVTKPLWTRVLRGEPIKLQDVEAVEGQVFAVMAKGTYDIYVVYSNGEFKLYEPQGWRK